MFGKYIALVVLCITGTFSFAQFNEWVWMQGDTTIGATAVYGAKGIPSPLNNPGPKYEALEWTDTSGNFWMFGGAYPKTGKKSAVLWKYDPAINIWTWIHGDTVPEIKATYGSLGVPSTSNNPGSRGFGTLSWTDKNNNLWLFGGFGFANNDTKAGCLNDLWKYNIVTDEWTWMKGDSVIDQPGKYGIKGIPDASNKPGSRFETSCSWTDNNGNLWMFGGNGRDDANNSGPLNDLWKYNPFANEWIWMSGAEVTGQAPIYGIKGKASANNRPGARWAFASWTDTSGNLWLYGGMNNGNYNDLWKYNIGTGWWTWMNGHNGINQASIYGTKCVESSSNVPGARGETRARWIDECGNLWLFGSTIAGGNINDLWRYDVSTDSWTWVSGDSIVGQPSIYGTKGVPAPDNKPSARSGSVSWTNKEGLWLYSGSPWTTSAGDLWKYIPEKSTAAFTASQDSGYAPLTVSFSSLSNCGKTKSGLWDFEDPLSGSNNTSVLDSPSHTFNSPGTYNVKHFITDCFGKKDTAMQTLIVFKDPCEIGALFVPNSFSPNADGQNDILYVRSECIRSMSFEIYNRWGSKVFETTNLQQGWDGTFEQEHLFTGVFVYFLKVELLNGEKITRTGNVALIR